MTRVGSVQWAAPEVLLGKPYSHKCDLWSFGVVCWEMLTSQVPFEKMPQAVVATRVALEGMRLPVPARAPSGLLKLIARCWSEQPSHRPDFRDVSGPTGASWGDGRAGAGRGAGLRRDWHGQAGACESLSRVVPSLCAGRARAGGCAPLPARRLATLGVASRE